MKDTFEKREFFFMGKQISQIYTVELSIFKIWCSAVVCPLEDESVALLTELYHISNLNHIASTCLKSCFRH